MKRLWISLLMLFGCSKYDQDGNTIYTIKKDKHRSTNKIKTTRSNFLPFLVTFDESAVYTTIDPNNQYDINKLFGLSDCRTTHTANSIRLGWRWSNDSLQIHWFKHEDGEFSFKLLKEIEINKTYEAFIIINNDSYVVGFDNEVDTIPRSCSIRSDNIKYYLWPYFGGDETAPHTIKIKIKEL
jgi:hypothetical protein